jgi:outer membrane lipoprotein SlyB
MVILFCAIAGAALGGSNATRRGGNRLDLVQYATVGAIAGAILGMFATVAIERML